MKTITIEIPDGYEAVKTENGYEIVPEKDKEKKWEDFGEVKGWFIDNITTFQSYSSKCSYFDNRNVFPSKKEANAYGLVLPQLLQWRDKVNGDWKPDWNDCHQAKWCIRQDCYDMVISSNIRFYQPLHFKTKEVAKQFLKDNKSLIEQLIL